MGNFSSYSRESGKVSHKHDQKSIDIGYEVESACTKARNMLERAERGYTTQLALISYFSNDLLQHTPVQCVVLFISLLVL